MNNFRPLPLLNFPRSDHGNKELYILYFMKFFCHIFFKFIRKLYSNKYSIVNNTMWLRS